MASQLQPFVLAADPRFSLPLFHQLPEIESPALFGPMLNLKLLCRFIGFYFRFNASQLRL
jgi:hypothetical protein